MDIKKYFQFTGTISGTNYLLRSLLSSLLSFFSGYGFGYGINYGGNALVFFSMILLVVVLWFSFTTIWKRMNALALFAKKVTLLTAGLIFLQLISTIFEQGNLLKVMLTLALFVINLFLVFKSSEIKEHNG